MDPLTAGMLVAGGTSLLGYFGQRETNQMSLDQARENREWQQAMSGSAHQREVIDLQKAGLNPILSAGGTGATTPQGNVAELSSPTSQLASGLSKGMDTAMAMRAQNKAIEGQDVQISNTKEDTFNKKLQGSLIFQQSQQTAKDVEAKGYQNEILKSTLKAQIKKAIAEGDYAEVNQIMGLINAGASSAASLINPFSKMLKGK